LEFSIAILLVISVFALYVNPTVDANGSVRSYEKRSVGTFEIGLGTVPASPSPGVVHFAAYVQDIGTGVRYLNANVRLTASGPGSQDPEIGPEKMPNNLMDPSYYELNTAVDRDGIWFVMIEVSTSDAEASTVFEMKVQERNSVLPILTLGALIAFLIILGTSARAWVREYRKKS
jgi:hypothetical protein